MVSSCRSKAVKPILRFSSVNASSYDLAISYETETGRIGENKVTLAPRLQKGIDLQELNAQANADKTGSGYAIAPDSDDVLLWLDFGQSRIERADDDADYYAKSGAKIWSANSMLMVAHGRTILTAE